MSDIDMDELAERLVQSALTATGGQSAEASLLLVDAAMAILLRCHHEGPARELVRMISGYMVELVDAHFGVEATVQ